MRRLIWAALCTLVACENPDVRSDIVVYADHNPGITNGGASITNPFTAQSTPDTYQTTFENGAWTPWRRVSSGAGSTSRPAVADVNGDLNAMTQFINILEEHLVK